MWFSNKRAKLRRQDKNDEFKPDRQQHYQQQLIAVPQHVAQHSQIIHPSAIPTVTGQYAVAPQLLEAERQKSPSVDNNKQVHFTDLRTLHEGNHNALQGILIPSSQTYDIGQTNVAVMPTVQATPAFTIGNVPTQVKATTVGIKTETPPLTPMETSKLVSSSQNSTQIIYLLQTGPKETPSYVAYVVPKNVPVSDIVTSSNGSWSVYDTSKHTEKTGDTFTVHSEKAVSEKSSTKTILTEQYDNKKQFIENTSQIVSAV